jgi:TonB family protein
MRNLLILGFLMLGITAKAQTRVSVENVKVYSFVEKMPVFPGDTVEKYVQQNVHFPEGGRKEGAVWVKFIVNPDGSVSDVEVSKTMGKDYDAEALRVVRAMPKWEPGTQGGTPVKVWMRVPVKFKQKN